MCDQAEHLGLDVRPVRIARLGYCNEISSVEDRRDTVNVQQVRRQRGGMGRRDRRPGRKVFDECGWETFGEDTVVGNEL